MLKKVKDDQEKLNKYNCAAVETQVRSCKETRLQGVATFDKTDRLGCD